MENPSSPVKCWAAAQAGGATPMAATLSTLCPTRETSRPNSPRRASLCWWRSSRSGPIPAGRGSGAAVSATKSIFELLVDCYTIVTADRVRLGCYGVAGGNAGKPFCVTVDLEGKARELGGLVDGEPVKAGQVVRVVTTGGGGWGDPLERETHMVLRDVTEGKVSATAALQEYGVVLLKAGDSNDYQVDEAATTKLRSERQSGRTGPLPMIDQGPGYAAMRAVAAAQEIGFMPEPGSA